MDDLVVVAVLLALAYGMYRYGKRLGSRSGYHAGRSRRRSRRY